MSLLFKILIGALIIQLIICIITGISKSRSGGYFFEGFFEGIFILDLLDALSDIDWHDFDGWD